MKNGKVTEVGPARKWSSPDGQRTVYYHAIKLDNGDEGEIGKKNENGVKVGDELNYTLEAGQYGNKIKPVQQQQFGGGGNRQPSSPASFALSYAKDLAVANINKAEAPIPLDSLADKVIATADKFNKWLKENQ